MDMCLHFLYLSFSLHTYICIGTSLCMYVVTPPPTTHTHTQINLGAAAFPDVLPTVIFCEATPEEVRASCSGGSDAVHLLMWWIGVRAGGRASHVMGWDAVRLLMWSGLEIGVDRSQGRLSMLLSDRPEL